MTTRDAFSEAFTLSSRNGVDASIKVTKPKMSARKLFSHASGVASPIRGDAVLKGIGQLVMKLGVWGSKIVLVVAYHWQ